MVTFLFFVYTITEAKQYAELGRAEPGLEPGLEPGRWIFQPGHLTWCALIILQKAMPSCAFTQVENEEVVRMKLVKRILQMRRK